MSGARDGRALSAAQRTLLASLLRERAPARPRRIARVDDAGPAPASSSQRHLWLAHQLAPDSPSYNITYQLELDGALDVEALRRSLTAIRRRHEVLRTTYREDGGAVVQIVDPVAELALPVIALTADAADAWVASAAARPFDLARGPIMRVALLQLAAHRHRLIATIHHIATDAWSIGLFLRELTALYRAETEGGAPVLPALPIQFGDFARWQHARATDAARRLDYWKAQLGEVAPLDLPTDFVRSPDAAAEGCRRSWHLPVLAPLQALATRAQTTLFAVLHAGLAILLHRYTGKTDIVVGTPLANRDAVEVEALLGCFSTTVALRCDLAGDPRVRDVLAACARAAVDAQDHELPFEQVVAAVRPERVAGRNPLFQVMLVFQNAAPPAVELAGLAIAMREAHSGTAKFDLDVSFAIADDGLHVSIEYRRDLFRDDTIDRLVDHLATLFTEMARDPDQRIAALALLTAAERHQIVDAWNRTEVAFDDDRCLHQLAEAHAARTPDLPAVVFRGATLTYRALDQRADAVARQLRRLGVDRNQPVGISMDRSFELVIGLLAILKAGGAYLPLDPSYPRDRLAFMMSDAAVRVVVAQPHLVELVAAPGRHVVVLDGSAPADDVDDLAPSKVTARDLAYVIYTSGSTGRPKAVMVDHRGRVNNFADFNRRFAIGPGDRLLSVSSLSFDMSAYDVFGTLMAGATIVLPDPELERDPAHWAELMVRERVTVWHSVPALLGMLVDLGVALPDLRLALLGGDWIPVSLPGRVRQLAPALRFISMGGATEVSMDSTIYDVDAVEQTWKSIPYGVPMANQRCYVLDPAGAPVPIGVPGELFLGGIGLAWGYLGHAALTADKFTPDPFSPVAGARMYRTGDLARYLPDGNLELIGRLDFQCKIRGYRIELGEIQAALEAHPAIDKALATVREVDGRKLLVAYVTGRGATAAELRARLAERLPDYMVPAHIVFLDAFPLTPNGKLDRRNLPAPARDDRATRIEPRTATERQLAQIWSEVLRLDRIAADDSFFALGGDSVMAIQVVSRARAAGLALTPRQIFRHQVLSELARAADGAHAVAAPALEVGDRGRLAPMQRTMLREHRRGGAPGLYVIQDATFLPGRFDRAAVERAWADVIARHDALRTCFVWNDVRNDVRNDVWNDAGDARAVIRDAAALELEVTSLADLPLDDQEREVQRLIAAHRARGFDLARAPLVRMHAIELGDATLLLRFNHYAILDGWSSLLLTRDLLVAYEAAQAGTAPRFAPARSFADYIAWVYAQDWDAARAYWRDALRGFARANPLPAPHADDEERAPIAKHAATARIDRGALRAAGITTATAVQAAWGLALAAATGDRDIVFGATVAGRAAELEGVETIVGLLINMLPVRLAIDPAQSIGALLDALQRARAEASAFEYLPLDQIIALAGAPLFDSAVVFANYPIDDALRAFGAANAAPHPLAQRDFTCNQTELAARLDASEAGDDVALRLTFDPARLADRAARRMLDHAAALLAALGDLTAAIARLPGPA